MAEVNVADIKVFNGKTIAIVAAIIALLGFVGLAIGLGVDPSRTWLSYLMAYWFAFSVVVGALIFSMAGYATNASWMAVVRRVVEICVLPMPALALLFVAIPFGIGHLYPWHTPPAGLTGHEIEVLRHRAPYMNVPFFVVRGAIYFLVLLIASLLLRRWSVRRDALGHTPDGDPKEQLDRERAFASGMLPPVALALTFAGIDWVMALNPIWYSSVFGFYVFAGGFLAGIALATLFAAQLWSRNSTAGALTPNHFHALGRLMLAFTIFWTYIAFFQAMLIRIANKPEEVSFYIARTHGAWLVFWYILILGHFAAPFLVLLLRAPKFRPRVMAWTGVWLVLMNLVDVYWLVIPSRVQGDHVFSWLDLAALAAVLGTSVACAAWRQHGVAVAAFRDPFFVKGASYRSKQL
ncbi:MAG: hypothetical protein ACM31C_05910 [Acidobacteriota bacterium]